MERGCPLCNGILNVQRNCPKCSGLMENAGMVEDYYGPYSPYENMDLYELPVYRSPEGKPPCVHLFACTRCGYDERLAFGQVIL